MFLKGMLVKNWPTLLRIGEMASERSQAEYLANSENQNSRTCGWVTLRSIASRNLSSVKSRGRSKSVLPGFSSRVRSAFRRMCSNLGPQKSAQTFFKNGDHAGGDQIPMVGRNVFQGIEGHGVFEVGWVEIDHVLDPALRDQLQDLLGQVAVGIDQGQAVARLNVVGSHVQEERRFATDPIELAEVYLGEFEIRLLLGGNTSPQA